MCVVCVEVEQENEMCGAWNQEGLHGQVPLRARRRGAALREGTFTTCRGAMYIHNFYLPPLGSKYVCFSKHREFVRGVRLEHRHG